ncbi:MAG: hypothetical protein CFE37_13860 [Alphaproteobacteria bacterium PA4]|nr:MAG: hypothetical protein CFE37_13860 [Alphaproteobacteria bacterium PA4]
MTDDPARLNADGLAALRRGDGAAAVILFRNAVALDGDAPQLWFNLATALNLTGDTAAELLALDSALDRDPFLVEALFARGYVCERLGEPVAALQDYRRLLAAIDPAARYGPGLSAGIDHARALVTAEQEAQAVQLEAALGPMLDAIPPEDRLRFEHCVEIGLGRRRVYHHQPLVLTYPYLPAEQFLDRRHFPWLPQLEAATPVIRAELEALLAAGDAGFAPYVAYPPGAPVNQWAGLNHNDAWAAQFLTQHGVPNAVMRARCPQTAAVLDSLPLFDCPGRGPVAFFSLLKPHTHIPPHTGATNIRSIIHLPLIVPENCVFRVGSDSRPWVEGEAFAFDDTIEHEARNGSDRLRAVLIIDAWNPHLSATERDLLRHYVATLDAGAARLQGFDPG